MIKQKLWILIFVLLCVTFTVSRSTAESLAFTPEEKAWLADHPAINLVGTSHIEPFVIPNHDGTFSGIIPDYLALISKKLGSKIFIQTLSPTGAGHALASKKEFYGLATVFDTPKTRRLYHLTIPYIQARYNVFTTAALQTGIKTKADLKGRRVAVLQGHFGMQAYVKNFENAEIVEAETPVDQLKMLQNKEVDAIIGYVHYHFLITHLMLTNVKLAFPAVESAAVHIGISRDHPALLPILNKAISALPEPEMHRISVKWIDLYAPVHHPEKWLAKIDLSTTAPDLDLTPEEIEYLKGKTDLSVAHLDDFAPFSFIGDDGTPAGYSVDYMQVLVERLGKRARFVSAPWGKLLGMLKSGNLDIIPHIAVTEERKAFVDYTNFTHVAYTIGFAVRKNEQIESMADLAGKTLAVVDKNFLHDDLKVHYPNITLLLVKNNSQGIDAVSQDKAFAVAGSLPYLNFYIQKEWLNNLKTLTIKDLNLPVKNQLPMGVKKGNALLRSIVEKANASMPPETIHQLKQKWIYGNVNDQGNFSLNKRETAFLSRHPAIRFRVRPDRPPFDFEKDGEAAGLSVDYLKAVCRKVGIMPRFVLDNALPEENFKMMETNRAQFDTLAFLVKNDAWSRRFAFGDTYLSYPMMIISHKNGPYIGKTADLNGKEVAIEKEYLSNKWLRRDYPGIKIVPADSTKEALRMVNEEQVDAYIGNLAVANYMMVHGGMENLKVAAPSDYGNIKYDFVAPKEWPELASILSKGYRRLSPHEHSTLQQKWFSFQMVERMDYAFFWKTLGVIALMVSCVLWWNRKLRIQKNKTDTALIQLQETQALLREKYGELEKLSVTDKLTTLYNRMKLDEVLKAELERARRYGGDLGLIMMDIDFFKRVNDTYGHQAGDLVLVELAGILKKSFRKIDTAGRWGGEEFMVICPQTGQEGLMTAAGTLRQTIEAHEFPQVGHITISSGVALYREDDSVDTLISRSDKALYQSKKNGRNRVTLG